MNVRRIRVLAAAVALAAPVGTARAATITINNVDTGTLGFNDPAAAAPVGGNAGTTIGAQRLNVFKKAAQLWGDALESVPTIVVDASFAELPCDMNQITLGQASAATFKVNFSGGPMNTYVPIALANAIAGMDLNGATAEIMAMFNGGLDSCTSNQKWYYGVDANAGDDIDLLSVVLHEFGHGLGFTSTVNPSNGKIQNGFVDVFIQHVYDNGTNKMWTDMTDSERATSTQNARHMVWDGPNLARQAPQIMAKGSPSMTATPAITGLFGRISEAEFGTYLSAKSVSGPLKIGAVSPTFCDLSDDLTGAVVLVSSALCPGFEMAYYAEMQGAVGLMVMDQIVVDPPYSVSEIPSARDTFPVTIPVVGVSTHDAMLLGSAPSSTTITLSAAADQQVGMDTSGRTDLFASSPVQGFSTLAHWDPLARPDLLMEPEIASKAPHDMRMELAAFRDIGWHTVCGNGKMDSGEQCDLGDQNGAPGAACNSDCTGGTGSSGSGGATGSGGSGSGGNPSGSGGATGSGGSASGSGGNGSGSGGSASGSGGNGSGSGGNTSSGSGGTSSSGGSSPPGSGGSGTTTGGGGGGGCATAGEVAPSVTGVSLMLLAVASSFAPGRRRRGAGGPRRTR